MQCCLGRTTSGAERETGREARKGDKKSAKIIGGGAFRHIDYI